MVMVYTLFSFIWYLQGYLSYLCEEKLLSYAQTLL